MDVNNVGLNDCTGLDLLDGFSVWVHYENDQKIFVENYYKKGGEKLVVLSAKSGIVYQDGKFLSVGYEPSFILSQNEWITLPKSTAVFPEIDDGSA